MPEYQYAHPDTGEIITRFQSVNDIHEYVLAGVKWDRVWTVPQIAMDTKIDPNNAKSFLDKTSKPGQSYGDLLDRAAEQSEMRKEKNGGVDPVVAAYEKEKGKTLPKKRSKEVKIEIG